jgi:hypothetical protein
MDAKWQFVCFLVAFICFVIEAIRAGKALNFVAIGLAFWVFVYVVIEAKVM